MVEFLKIGFSACLSDLSHPSVQPTGGYHTDRHCFGPNCPWDNDGGGEGAAFRLYQWELIDVFVYFSHQFITVPPPGWTALCHRHGAKALGTFITEWEAGKEKCRRVFESRCVV